MDMHERKIEAAQQAITDVYTDISVDISVTISDLERLKELVSDCLFAVRKMKELE